MLQTKAVLLSSHYLLHHVQVSRISRFLLVQEIRKFQLSLRPEHVTNSLLSTWAPRIFDSFQSSSRGISKSERLIAIQALTSFTYSLHQFNCRLQSFRSGISVEVYQSSDREVEEWRCYFWRPYLASDCRVSSYDGLEVQRRDLDSCESEYRFARAWSGSFRRLLARCGVSRIRGWGFFHKEKEIEKLLSRVLSRFACTVRSPIF